MSTAGTDKHRTDLALIRAKRNCETNLLRLHWESPIKTIKLSQTKNFSVPLAMVIVTRPSPRNHQQTDLLCFRVFGSTPWKILTPSEVARKYHFIPAFIVHCPTTNIQGLDTEKTPSERIYGGYRSAAQRNGLHLFALGILISSPWADRGLPQVS